MAWRNHYVRWTRVNWAMSLSGCGIPTLKLKICLLQCEVQTSLSDWGVKRQDYIGCWQAADARWNSRGHDGFSPCWCKVMLFQVATNRRTCPALSGEIGCYIWSYKFFIIITNSMHISMCYSTYLQSKVLPSVFPSLWTLVHHCAMSNFIETLCFLICAWFFCFVFLLPPVQWDYLHFKLKIPKKTWAAWWNSLMN